MFVQVAPSGVVVESTVPFIEPGWMDKGPVRHVVWSWSSWITRILAAYGHAAPHAWFQRVMNAA